MKASTLVAHLTALIAEHGDGNICVGHEEDCPYVSHVTAEPVDKSVEFVIAYTPSQWMRELSRKAA